jgi:hypothetical protein
MRSFFLLTILIAANALGQDSDQQPARCSELEYYKLLDFWLGEWDVYSGEKLVGTNIIEKVLGGCAVLEHWTGAGGGKGKSLFFVTGERIWKQVWVTEWAVMPGGVKEKTRQPTDLTNQVRFQGVIVLPDGGKYLDRTTLTRLDSGKVRQLIEVSNDDGGTWKATFDVVYRPG